MSDDDQSTVRRVVPQSGLDFSMMTTDTVWGHPQVGQQLKTKIQDRFTARDTLDKAKNNDLSGDTAWDLLSFYTRDMRLANLSGTQIDYCSYYIDLAGDFLREGYPESFATALSRAATMLELSQSKGGFFRKRQNTLTQEHMSGELGAKKKRLVFGGKKEE